MAAKITITLDSKADHDLLVGTLHRRSQDLKEKLDADLEKADGERMRLSAKREIAQEQFALEQLIAKVS